LAMRAGHLEVRQMADTAITFTSNEVSTRRSRRKHD
jgi:hypothetical protein